ncbi:hypothetical protein [Hoyosella rhizosphaerae]|uniref:Uncharacterized protein n=1 Tax=Hoyosella rhizosphaerae TaxID=1755582 RepID=A0A916X9P3_9ACTN|nr:hypothetical protein [Hoyosella rhizosphaerae]GGC54122.1 hypothetical protein GCM10011410_03060 [Hoyosella rhizosphaerae]
MSSPRPVQPCITDPLQNSGGNVAVLVIGPQDGTKIADVTGGGLQIHPASCGGAISRVSDQTECWVGGGTSGDPYLAFSDKYNLASALGNTDIRR